jgi:DNA-binding NtrC family response regulator
MPPPKLLIVGDSGELFKMVNRLLPLSEFTVLQAVNRRYLKSVIHRYTPSLTLYISSSRSTSKGVKMIADIRKTDKSVPVILITDQSSESLAIAALRAGVNDYIKVPFSDRELLESCRRLIQDKMSTDSVAVEMDMLPPPPDRLMIGNSHSMQEIKSFIVKVAKTDSTVLITGETGTGKEIAAELIHRYSNRKARPFICINCAALPETLVESELFGHERGAFTGAVATRRGKLEIAGGGTLLLDEIGDMPLPAQAKILRSIENKKIFHLGGRRSIRIDARVIAATNQDLKKLMAEGKFRKDLFYRLNVAQIDLPPLRDRKDDIPHLVKYAVSELNRRFGTDVEDLCQASLKSLYRYHWPGNVRELFNCIESSFISLPTRKTRFIELPKRIKKQLKIEVRDCHLERNQILETLMDSKWNKSKAAKKLNWSRMTLYRKIDKYNIIKERQPR